VRRSWHWTRIPQGNGVYSQIVVQSLRHAPDRVGFELFEARWDRISKVRKAAVVLVVVAFPFFAVLLRGICWESLVISMVAVPLVLSVIRIPWTLWTGMVVAVWAIGVFSLVAWSGIQFHTLNVFSASPPRITWCGRDYLPGRGFRQPSRIVPVHEVGVTPSGESIVGWRCDSADLWVKTGDHSYVGYALSGGP
jgi:hypothetical protein